MGEIVELIGEPKQEELSTFTKRSLKYNNITASTSIAQLNIVITGTGRNTAFKILMSPTSNCQVMSVGSMNGFLSCVLGGYYYKEGRSYPVTSLERIEMFLAVVREVQHALTVAIGGQNFRIWVIDVNQSYKKYFEKDFLDLPETCYLLKHDYASTNGSGMHIAMLRMESVITHLINKINNEKAKVLVI